MQYLYPISNIQYPIYNIQYLISNHYCLIKYFKTDEFKEQNIYRHLRGSNFRM
jgi:hypothetical protein